MCASGSAYNINAATGLYTPDAIFSPAVGYIGAPQPIERDQINACLVGQNSDGIIVAFRGTLPPSLHSADSLHDWLVDFFVVPKVVPGKVPGAVHSGFYDAVNEIIAPVAQAVKTLDPGLTIPVYVTGHSKGGGMASIGAYLLNQSFGIPVHQVVTFASPKPGDSGFRAGYQAAIPNQIRYENYGDLVPLVPPSHMPVDLLIRIFQRISPDLAAKFKQARDEWDYQPVGSLMFIESSSSLYQTTPDESIESQVLAVFEEVARDLLAFNFTSIGEAHTLACGRGYMRGTCPLSVCGS
jgi:Lipase (class 3)